MSVELIAISSFVVAILGGLAHCVKRSNLKECKMCCMASNCRDEDKVMEERIKELNEKIVKNEKKANKNKFKLDYLIIKKVFKSPSSGQLSKSIESIQREIISKGTASRDSVFYDENNMITTEL